MNEELNGTLVEQDTGFGVIDRVSSEVLETMFFTEAVAGECDHSWLPSAITARIRFEGSHVGEFLLSVSLEASRPIAAGFLGLTDDETTEQDCSQVILELANILCGAVLSNRWPDSRLTLNTPDLAGCECASKSTLHRCFTLPEGMLAVTICCGNASEPEG